MKSEIAKKLKLKYSPVAILSTKEKPQDALGFVEGRWGCVSSLLIEAAKGRRAVFSRSTFGCEGGGMGLGFLNQHSDGSDYFMSVGKDGFDGQAVKNTPQLGKDYLDSVTRNTIIPEQYIVFTPLTEIDDTREEPKVVVFYANPDQLSALVILANYGRTGIDNVIIHTGGGCQTACRFPWSEAAKEHPRAFVGMMDITARAFIDADLLTFSVPYDMFREMEKNVPGSFLDRTGWSKLSKRIQLNEE